MKSGVLSDFVVGTGAMIVIELASSDRKTWVYHAVSISVGGMVTHMDKDYYIVALNGTTPLGVVVVSEHAAGPTVTHQDVNYGRIPSSVLQLVVPGSTLNTLYTLTAIWEEDR